MSLSTANKNLLTISFIFYTTQNKISPNIGTLFNGALRSKLLNSPFASWSLINLDFFLSYIAHFDNIIALPLLVPEILDLCFQYLFYTLSNKISFYIYSFKLLLITLLHLITSLMPIFLPSWIRLIFSKSLLWLFIIPMLSFSYLYFFSSLKSSWVISLFINSSDILLSLLFNLLLASITIILCFFFLFLVLFLIALLWFL